jgi:transposase InsO family protein
MTETPTRKGEIYASDLIYVKFQEKWIYPTTVIDLYTREIVGVAILTTHVAQLVMNSLLIQYYRDYHQESYMVTKEVGMLQKTIPS